LFEVLPGYVEAGATTLKGLADLRQTENLKNSAFADNAISTVCRANETTDAMGVHICFMAAHSASPFLSLYPATSGL
jgi:hypothetical protein